ncbi:MAG: diguanylate cyclase [Solirubrobacteraceae bacterium]|nr:diguanylate cyclase [Solirubrobacteraceae bacterium]
MAQTERAATEAARASSRADGAGASGDVIAAGRDDAAVGRERVSEARDRAADARDRAAEQRESAEGPGGPEYAIAVMQAAKVRALAADDRDRAAADRHLAAHDRLEAAADRSRAASERRHAALDRDHAATDRRAAHAELERAHTDDLTGAYRRGAGTLVLQHELERAQRSGESLVVAFVDVDGLKETNDRHGHAAGDARLCGVVSAMRAKLRGYEPIVRYGGDEFLCSIAGLSLEGVQTRFAEINAALSTGQAGGSISVGRTQMQAGDTLEQMIERADSDLAEVRGDAHRL